jgi:hypothetical protein
MSRDPFNVAIATDAWGKGTIHDTGETERRIHKHDVEFLHIDISKERTEIKGTPTETDFIVGIRFKIENGNPILVIEHIPGPIEIKEHGLDPS